MFEAEAKAADAAAMAGPTATALSRAEWRSEAREKAAMGGGGQCGSSQTEARAASLKLLEN